VRPRQNLSDLKEKKRLPMQRERVSTQLFKKGRRDRVNNIVIRESMRRKYERKKNLGRTD